jgi:hypothetical protein
MGCLSLLPPVGFGREYDSRALAHYPSSFTENCIHDFLCVLNDAEDGFNRGFAFGVKRLAFPGLRPVVHGLHRSPAE